MSKQGKSQNRQSQNSEVKLKIIEWVEKLGSHFGTALGEEQIEIFLHALRDCTAYQIEGAFERCLNECQFMPKLADVHQRMPEQRYAPENPGRFVQQKPILDVIRPIAEEICKGLTGREYNELDTVKDASLIEKVFHEANTMRLTRAA